MLFFVVIKSLMPFGVQYEKLAVAKVNIFRCDAWISDFITTKTASFSYWTPKGTTKYEKVIRYRQFLFCRRVKPTFDHHMYLDL